MRDSGSGPRARVSWALAGLLLATGAPAGLWLLLRCLGHDAAALGAHGSIARAALIYSAIGTALAFTAMGAFAGSLMDRQRDAALRDGLTGLYNRRFLREVLPRLQASAQRSGAPLCAIMLDLDHFKRVNDVHGHLVGDQTLRAVARVLDECSRRTDVVARYGGEEFAVLCPDTQLDRAEQVAERLRAAIEALDANRLGFPGPQTISLGVAEQSSAYSPSPEQLLDDADAALYRAKHEGRNCVRSTSDGQVTLGSR